MKVTYLAAAAVSLVAIAGCAQNGAYAPSASAAGAPVAANVAASPRLPQAQCFRSHDIRNHTVGDARTMYIDVAGRSVYRLDMGSACLAGATNSDPIVTHEPPGSNVVCRGIDLDLSVSKGGFPTRCIVTNITQLSPEQAAALPRGQRP